MLGGFQQEILEGLRRGMPLSKECNWTGRPWRKVVRATESLIRQGKIKASGSGYIFSDHLSDGKQEDSQPPAAYRGELSLKRGMIYRVWHVTDNATIFELEVVRTNQGYLSREVGERAWEDDYLFKLEGSPPSYFLTYQEAFAYRDSLLSQDKRADKISLLKNRVRGLSDKIVKINQRIERLEEENG